MKIIITDTGTYPGRINIEDRVIRPQNNIHPCTGCFQCWTHTPGVCAQNDDAQYFGLMLSKCDELLIVSRCFHGSVSPFIKMVLERAIPYVQPSFEIRNHVMRHVSRYTNRITIHVCFYEKHVTKEEKELAEQMMKDMAENLHQNEVHIHWFKDAWQMGEIL